MSEPTELSIPQPAPETLISKEAAIKWANEPISNVEGYPSNHSVEVNEAMNSLAYAGGCASYIYHGKALPDSYNGAGAATLKQEWKTYTGTSRCILLKEQLKLTLQQLDQFAKNEKGSGTGNLVPPPDKALVHEVFNSAHAVFDPENERGAYNRRMLEEAAAILELPPLGQTQGPMVNAMRRKARQEMHK